MFLSSSSSSWLHERYDSASDISDVNYYFQLNHFLLVMPTYRPAILHIAHVRSCCYSLPYVAEANSVTYTAFQWNRNYSVLFFSNIFFLTIFRNYSSCSPSNGTNSNNYIGSNYYIFFGKKNKDNHTMILILSDQKISLLALYRYSVPHIYKNFWSRFLVTLLTPSKIAETRV
jgi:hypothetical protein